MAAIFPYRAGGDDTTFLDRSFFFFFFLLNLVLFLFFLPSPCTPRSGHMNVLSADYLIGGKLSLQSPLHHREALHDCLVCLPSPQGR